MNRRDLPPGHRLFRFKRRVPDLPNEIDPGDLFEEHGPRLGVRWWEAVDVQACRTLDHVAMRPVRADELEALSHDTDRRRFYLTR